MGEVRSIGSLPARGVRIATFDDNPGFWQLEFLYHPSILGGGTWRPLPDGKGDFTNHVMVEAALEKWRSMGMPCYPDVVHGDDPGRAA